MRPKGHDRPNPARSTGISATLASVGDNCIDAYLPPVDCRFAGGNAVNVAAGLRRAGFAVDYFGAVGNDTDGRTMIAVLEREGIGTSWVRVLDAPTSVTEIRLANGEREFSDYAVEAAELFRLGSREMKELAGRGNVHGVHLENDMTLFLALAESGVRLSYDFAEQRDLAVVCGLDVAFFSARDDESLTDARELAQAAASGGARQAVVMCGARGSVGCDGKALVRVRAQPIVPVDTCGAGDSYIAAFVAGRIHGNDLEWCMHAGTGAATLTCARLGMLPIEQTGACPRDSAEHAGASSPA